MMEIMCKNADSISDTSDTVLLQLRLKNKTFQNQGVFPKQQSKDIQRLVANANYNYNNGRNFCLHCILVCKKESSFYFSLFLVLLN